MSMVGLGSVSSYLVQKTTLLVAVVGQNAAKASETPDVSPATIDQELNSIPTQ